MSIKNRIFDNQVKLQMFFLTYNILIIFSFKTDISELSFVMFSIKKDD